MNWNIDTLWFDVCLVTALTSVGSIFFGHFEEHTPKWRRVLKLLLFVGLVVLITSTIGRLWTYVFLGAMLAAVAVVHGFVLPSKGINGLTAKPRDKYYRLRGWERYLDSR
ncbi:MAG: hypothetical protein AB7K37_10995 [Cyclobacteriaceae bacterium]